VFAVKESSGNNWVSTPQVLFNPVPVIIPTEYSPSRAAAGGHDSDDPHGRARWWRRQIGHHYAHQIFPNALDDTHRITESPSGRGPPRHSFQKAPHHEGSSVSPRRFLPSTALLYSTWGAKYSVAIHGSELQKRRVQLVEQRRARGRRRRSLSRGGGEAAVVDEDDEGSGQAGWRRGADGCR
jgi:hypothetical protein